MFVGSITLKVSNCLIFRMATKLLRLVKDKKKLDEGGSIIFTVDSVEMKPNWKFRNVLSRKGPFSAIWLFLKKCFTRRR